MTDFLISEKHNKIVLPRSRVPEEVLDHVQHTSHQGRELSALPWSIETAWMLRNMGLDVPSPITTAYDWPGRYTPMAHQIKTAAFATMNKYCFVLNDIGTGKSLSALWAADYLMKQGVLKSVLVLAPLSTLERVWGDEIFMNLYQRQSLVLHGTRARRLKLLDQPADFYIINHDGFEIIRDALAERPDINGIIVDECSVYRNAKTNRHKVFHNFVKKQPPEILWMMSGSPTPNAPTDAWGQVRLVNSEAVPKSFTRWRDMTMRKVTQFKWVPKHDAVETVRAAMTPAIRFKRDDCLDLPPTVYQYREAALTSLQNKLYKDMSDKLLVQFEQGEVTAANEGVKLMKLVQVCCGVLYGAEKRHRIDVKPRLKLLNELIEEVDPQEKIIVFTHLTEVVHMLYEALSKEHQCEKIYGATTPAQRNIVFKNFQFNNNPRIIVAHPGTMAHGLTLTSASTIIWYSPINSVEIYEQGNGRITRSGQDKKTSIAHLMSTKLEQQMYERLKQRQSLQGLLLDAIQERSK